MQKIIIWRLRGVDSYSYHSTYENARNAFINENKDFYDSSLKSEIIKSNFEKTFQQALFKMEFDLID